MENNKKIKIINFTASQFGHLKAIELDLSRFKNGELIEIKGGSGEGKSTIQKGLKICTQGSKTLADSEQYGDAWSIETQLLDGEKNIFISATKKDGQSAKFALYEKDNKGKKVNNPVINGMKATPAKYIEYVGTELTFGIKGFLSENNTIQTKLMFELFKNELRKQGIIFDKKNPDYKTSLLGILDDLVDKRDRLRSECTHIGAFMSDFERDGYDLDSLETLMFKDINFLTEQKTALLIKKGQLNGESKAAFEKKKSEIATKGQNIATEIKERVNDINSDFEFDLKTYNQFLKEKEENNELVNTELAGVLNNIYFVDNAKKDKTLDYFKRCFIDYYNRNNTEKPEKPILPQIGNNTINFENGINYIGFEKLQKDYLRVIAEYKNLEKPAEIDYSEIDNQISEVEKQIEIAEHNNKLVKRFDINRKWVESCAKVDEKRKELNKLYANIDTGVSGLRIKPFFNETGKLEMKTIYTGDYDPEYFKNPNKEERLLVSYSSTQKPIIGVLLQIARLKLKGKCLPYIFIDDVPIDKKARAIIAKIAAENGLNIILSVTGDFEKNKLSNNEILVEGGEIFFNELK